MSSSAFIGPHVWRQVSRAIRQAPGATSAAIAFVGRKSARLLPMGAGSLLVVDASERSVAAGLTHPADLLRLLRRGVTIRSVENLHAKIVVAGRVLFVGSANASTRSERLLHEAVLTSTDKSAVAAARAFIESLDGEDLGPRSLRRLQAIYRPPKTPNGTKRRHAVGSGARTRWRIVVVEEDEADARKERALKESRKEARLRQRESGHSRTHELHEFWWHSQPSFREGDRLVLLSDGPNARWLAPLSTIVTVKRDASSGPALYTVQAEAPRGHAWKALGQLGKRVSRRTLRRLQGRSGPLGDQEVLAELAALWR